MNFKNPTAVLFKRLANSDAGKPGALVQLLQKFFAANFGNASLPKTVADFTYYHQISAVAAVGTTLQFFQNTYDPNNANFPQSQFMLPQSEHALILGIAFRDGAAATVSATSWNVGVTEAAVKNGTVDFLINGQRVLRQLPMTEFDNNALSATTQGATDQSRGVFYFYEPLVLLAQTQIAANVQLKAATATVNYNLRAELKGVGFIG